MGKFQQTITLDIEGSRGILATIQEKIKNVLDEAAWELTNEIPEGKHWKLDIQIHEPVQKS